MLCTHVQTYISVRYLHTFPFKSILLFLNKNNTEGEKKSSHLGGDGHASVLFIFMRLSSSACPDEKAVISTERSTAAN